MGALRHLPPARPCTTTAYMLALMHSCSALPTAPSQATAHSLCIWNMQPVGLWGLEQTQLPSRLDPNSNPTCAELMHWKAYLRGTGSCIHSAHSPPPDPVPKPCCCAWPTNTVHITSGTAGIRRGFEVPHSNSHSLPSCAIKLPHTAYWVQSDAWGFPRVQHSIRHAEGPCLAAAGSARLQPGPDCRHAWRHAVGSKQDICLRDQAALQLYLYTLHIYTVTRTLNDLLVAPTHTG